MRIFSESVDLRSRKEMTAYLQNHVNNKVILMILASIEFNKSITSVFQDIENLKNEPNADTESYNALQNNISKMISDRQAYQD